MSAETNPNGLIESLAQVLADFRSALIARGLSEHLADELTIAYLAQSIMQADSSE